MADNNGLILRGDKWTMRFELKGIKVYESTGTSNRREAEMILARRKSAIIDQTMLGKKRIIKLHAAIDGFVKSRSHLPSNGARKNNLAHFKTVPDIDLDKVKPIQLQAVVDKRFADGKKASTVKTCVTYFNAMVNHYASLDYSVCKKIARIKGVKGRVRWLTDEEEAKLFAALDPDNQNPNGASQQRREQRQDNYDLCVVLRHTGARLSEISKMQWDQVDFNREEVHIKRAKGSNDSTIHMSIAMREVLTRRRQTEDGHKVFSTKYDLNKSNDWFRHAVKVAGINTENGSVSAHTLRHTAAVKWLQGGLGLVEVQHMLGHKDIESTMVYAHIVPSDASRKAAAINNKTDKTGLLPAHAVLSVRPLRAA